jgi:nucleoside-diphosphate-sugar epimerase
MRVIVVGASGRVGRSLVAGLADNKFIDKVVSLEEGEIPAPNERLDRRVLEQRSVELANDLADHFRFADAVVYAGWPVSSVGNGALGTRHLAVIENVCESVASAGVRLFVYGSSAGAYSPAPVGRLVEESWPTFGLVSHLSSLQMAEGEHLVDRLEDTHQALRVVRIRPSLIACPPMTALRRGSLLGRSMMAAFLQSGFVPDLGTHALQVVHVSDLARAFGLAVTGSVLGSFNITAAPITSDLVAQFFGARKLPVTLGAALELLSFSWGAGLHSVDPQTVHLALEAPLLDTTRARGELGWSPDHSAISMLEEWTDYVTTTNVPRASETHPRASGPPVDYPALYEQSLEYFGRLVHEIGEPQWKQPTGYRGWDIWQLVAFVAREQYRVALLLRGESKEIIESQLPNDPLGFARTDGWDLAAEKGTLAVERCVSAPMQAVGGDTERFLADILPDVICNLVLLGMCLSQVVRIDDTPDPELWWFVHQRMEPFEVG